MTTHPVQLSIIVVSYNTRDATIACLRSAIENAPAGSELVVVDNGSSDDSAAAVREAFPTATVIEAGRNLGFARGVNLGVRHATGDYIVLLNPDTVVLDGSLSTLVAFAVARPEFGLYGGRTIRRDGSTDPSSCWGAPSIWSLTCFATGLSTVFRRSRFFDPESLGRWERDSVREVPIVTGCLLLMRRAHWDALGGMEERFFLYGEDAEFSLRAARHGYRPVIVPDAVIVHDVGGSTASSGRKMTLVMAGKVTMLTRSWAWGRAAVGIRLLLLGTANRALLEWASRRRSTTWRTVWRARADWRAGYPRAERALFADADADAAGAEARV